MNRISKLCRAALVTLIFFALLAFAPGSTSAQEPAPVPPAEHAQGGPEGDWREILKMTPEQMAQIRAIRQRNAEEGQLIRRRVRLAQRALDQAIYADNVNEAEIDRLAQQFADAQASEVRLRAKNELSFRRVLTPEQLSSFRRIRQERMRDQMQRRMENANSPRPLGNRRIDNGLNQRRNNNAGRPDAIGPTDRKAPILAPRIRRGLGGGARP